MNTTDPRFQFGAKVHAKAIHVTSQIECHRRYGSNAKTKFLNGVVCRVETVPSSGKKRAVTLITANYYLGGSTIKTTVLNSRSVKAGHVTSVPNEGSGLVTESVNQNSVSVAATNPTSAAPEVNDPNPAPLNIEENNVSEIVALAGFAVDAEEFPQADIEEQAGSELETIAASSQTVATVHGMEWVRASTNDPPLNGNVPARMWSIRTSVGDVLVPGGNAVATRDISPLELFLLLFPPEQLSDMVHWTNVELNKASLKETTAREVLKFFGILIVMTKFEFTTRSSLWNTTAWSKYRPAPQFGLTGMSKHSFKDLFSSMRWSNQPDAPGEGESSEEYRWKLVDDFVKNFNEHQANYFNPSELICVDESMSRWYGQGGHWICCY